MAGWRLEWELRGNHAGDLEDRPFEFSAADLSDLDRDAPRANAEQEILAAWSEKALT
jgi:hypothetical protein